MKRTASVLFTALFVLSIVPLYAEGKVENTIPVKVQDKMHLTTLGKVKVEGHIGEKIDTVCNARIASDFAKNEIYPETLQAFVNRVDDRIKEKSGLWQGEFWGKWILSAIAYQKYTGDPKLAQFIQQSANDLIATRRDDGYIGTYHDSGFVVSSFYDHPRLGHMPRQNWNIWCRKYTLWGLMESYEMSGDPNILKAAMDFFDHLMTEVGPGKVNIADTGRFNGLPSESILTPLLMLYRHTGEKRYLDYAFYIVDQWSLYPDTPPDIINNGLSRKPVDKWFPEPEKWAKAYEFISCMEGLLELYRLDGNPDYLQAVINIQKSMRENERSIFGGIGKNDKLRGARFMLETEAEVCDVVYWNRLATQLLRLTGDPIYADDIELSMYNVLCAAMKLDGTWGVRRLCLNGAHWEAPKHCELEHQQCCVGNMPRGLLQLPEVAVMSMTNGLALNLYLPGTADLQTASGNQLKLTTHTTYPETGNVVVIVTPALSEKFTIQLRIPAWSSKTKLKVNGKSVRAKAGTYARIDREWKPGDRIELNLDMRGRVIPFPVEGSSYAAVMRGPVVLARDIRLGDINIHATAPLVESKGFFGVGKTVPYVPTKGYIELEKADAPDGMWMAFKVPLAGNKPIVMCDYSSAGQTWDAATSDFRVWLPGN